MFQRVPIACRNFSSAPGPLRKLEAIEPLVLDARRMAAHHVAHVQLRHFVVAHVDDLEARVRQRTDDRILLLAPLRELEAHEDPRALASP